MLQFDKFVRDPLYGFIGLTKKEIELLGTPTVQRLRRIKQLGNTHLVYPSACHSRFEHSLGVIHIANRMAEMLNLNDSEIEVVRYAALLHDIGHGPLSHNFESILEKINNKKVSHEEITLKIIKEDIDITKILGDKKQDVISLFDEKNDTVNSKIVSGNIDADRLDYLRRASFHIGVAYGIFDLERILHTIHEVSEDNGSEIGILKKGQDAIENYRLARFLMHTQVYYHHVRAITDNMLNRAVEIAVRDKILNNDLLKFENNKFLNNYLSLDDSRLFTKILSNPESNANKLIEGLENRNLLKRGYEIDIRKLKALKKRKIMQIKPDDFKELEKSLAEKCNCDADFIIIHLQKIENSLYKSSYEFFKSGETPLLIIDGDEIYEIDKESMISGSQEPLLKLYVFCPEEHKSQIKKVAESVLL